jgi:hypothetical protein
VIPGRLCNCGSPQTSHAWRKNPIAELKKHFEFYTSVFRKVQALIVAQNPFSQRENLPNTGEPQLVPAGGIDEKTDGLLTTSHVFWPNERRRPAFLLPISQPIPAFVEGEARHGDAPGGAGERRIAAKNCVFDKLVQKFYPKGSLPHFLLKKKGRRNRRAIQPTGGPPDYPPRFESTPWNTI